jgi:hypothetical protein
MMQVVCFSILCTCLFCMLFFVVPTLWLASGCWVTTELPRTVASLRQTTFRCWCTKRGRRMRRLWDTPSQRPDTPSVVQGLKHCSLAWVFVYEFLIHFKIVQFCGPGTRKRKWRGVVRETTLSGGGNKLFCPPVLKVPRHCPLVRLLEVCLRRRTVSFSAFFSLTRT